MKSLFSRVPNFPLFFIQFVILFSLLNSQYQRNTLGYSIYFVQGFRSRSARFCQIMSLLIQHEFVQMVLFMLTQMPKFFVHSPYITKFLFIPLTLIVYELFLYFFIFKIAVILIVYSYSWTIFAECCVVCSYVAGFYVLFKILELIKQKINDNCTGEM